MSATKTTNMTCDRCGFKDDVPDNDPKNRGYHWAKVWAQENNGPLRISNGHREILAADTQDLCPSCMTSLMTWWNTPK